MPWLAVKVTTIYSAAREGICCSAAPAATNSAAAKATTSSFSARVWGSTRSNISMPATASTFAILMSRLFRRLSIPRNRLVTMFRSISAMATSSSSKTRASQNLHSEQFIIANEVKGPSSSQTPYLVSSDSHVYTESLLTAGDSVGGYKMVGIPDGLGAFDNGDGTFTVLMNQEVLARAGRRARPWRQWCVRVRVGIRQDDAAGAVG